MGKWGLETESLWFYQNEHIDGGEHDTKGTNVNESYKNKVHKELCSLIKKYEDMAKK